MAHIFMSKMQELKAKSDPQKVNIHDTLKINFKFTKVKTLKVILKLWTYVQLWNVFTIYDVRKTFFFMKGLKTLEQSSVIQT